jgi:Spy/CpxP family protein refolding chaperone
LSESTSDPPSVEAPIGPASQPNGSRFKAIGILVAVFLLGGVAGGASMRVHMLSQWSDTMRAPPTKARARWRLDAMQRHLDLSDEQRSKLETILTESAEEREQLTDDCRPALDALRERTDARIREVLTPEQQTKHQEMMERMRERRGKRGGGRGKRDGHGPGGPGG